MTNFTIEPEPVRVETLDDLLRYCVQNGAEIRITPCDAIIDSTAIYLVCKSGEERLQISATFSNRQFRMFRGSDFAQFHINRMIYSMEKERAKNQNIQGRDAGPGRQLGVDEETAR